MWGDGRSGIFMEELSFGPSLAIGMTPTQVNPASPRQHFGSWGAVAAPHPPSSGQRLSFCTACSELITAPTAAHLCCVGPLMFSCECGGEHSYGCCLFCSSTQ